MQGVSSRCGEGTQECLEVGEVDRLCGVTGWQSEQQGNLEWLLAWDTGEGKAGKFRTSSLRSNGTPGLL